MLLLLLVPASLACSATPSANPAAPTEYEFCAPGLSAMGVPGGCVPMTQNSDGSFTTPYLQQIDDRDGGPGDSIGPIEYCDKAKSPVECYDIVCGDGVCTATPIPGYEGEDSPIEEMCVPADDGDICTDFQCNRDISRCDQIDYNPDIDAMGNNMDEPYVACLDDDNCFAVFCTDGFCQALNQPGLEPEAQDEGDDGDDDEDQDEDMGGGDDDGDDSERNPEDWLCDPDKFTGWGRHGGDARGWPKGGSPMASFQDCCFECAKTPGCLSINFRFEDKDGDKLMVPDVNDIEDSGEKRTEVEALLQDTAGTCFVKSGNVKVNGDKADPEQVGNFASASLVFDPARKQFLKL